MTIILSHWHMSVTSPGLQQLVLFNFYLFWITNRLNYPTRGCYLINWAGDKVLFAHDTSMFFDKKFNWSVTSYYLESVKTILCCFPLVLSSTCLPLNKSLRPCDTNILFSCLNSLGSLNIVVPKWFDSILTYILLSDLKFLVWTVLISVNLSITSFLGCVVIRESQIDERHIMLNFSCCGHIRSRKERCVWNKALVLGPTYLFTLQRHYLWKDAIDRKS